MALDFSKKAGGVKIIDGTIGAMSFNNVPVIFKVLSNGNVKMTVGAYEREVTVSEVTIDGVALANGTTGDQMADKLRDEVFF